MLADEGHSSDKGKGGGGKVICHPGKWIVKIYGAKSEGSCFSLHSGGTYRSNGSSR